VASALQAHQDREKALEQQLNQAESARQEAMQQLLALQQELHSLRESWKQMSGQLQASREETEKVRLEAANVLEETHQQHEAQVNQAEEKWEAEAEDMMRRELHKRDAELEEKAKELHRLQQNTLRFEEDTEVAKQVARETAAAKAAEHLEDEVRQEYATQQERLQDRVKQLTEKLSEALMRADMSEADADTQAQENKELREQMCIRSDEIDALKGQVIALRAKLNKNEADMKAALKDPQASPIVPSSTPMAEPRNQTPSRTPLRNSALKPTMIPSPADSPPVRALRRATSPLGTSSLNNTHNPASIGKAKPEVAAPPATSSEQSVVESLLEEIYQQADKQGTGVLSFHDFARWASWDGQVLEWLDSATRSLGTQLGSIEEEARGRFAKLPLSELLHMFRVDGRPCGSRVSEGDLHELLCSLLKVENSSEVDHLAHSVHAMLQRGELDWLATGTGLCLLCRGTQMEKLKASYDMMDQGGSGRIPRNKMSSWLSHVHKYSSAESC